MAAASASSGSIWKTGSWLKPVDEELTIAQLKTEFGLVPLDQYLARAERARRVNTAA